MHAIELLTTRDPPREFRDVDISGGWGVRYAAYHNSSMYSLLLPSLFLFFFYSLFNFLLLVKNLFFSFLILLPGDFPLFTVYFLNAYDNSDKQCFLSLVNLIILEFYDYS